MDSKPKTLRFVDSVEHLQQLNKDIVLDTSVNVDKLMPDWKPRSFQIRVPVSVVLTDLLHSIFDWTLMKELMSNDESNGTRILQKKVNDFELLNKLINSMQRIQISEKPENINFHVKLVIRRPSFEMEILDNGTIMVNRLPSLLIEVVAHDHLMTDDNKAMALPDANTITKVTVEEKHLESIQHVIEVNTEEFEYEYESSIDELHHLDTSFSSISTELFTIEEMDEPTETDENEDEEIERYSIIASRAKLSQSIHTEDTLSEIADFDQNQVEEVEVKEQLPPILEKQNQWRCRRYNHPFWNCMNYWMHKAIKRIIKIR